jgi:hypothetical protein
MYTTVLLNFVQGLKSVSQIVVPGGPPVVRGDLQAFSEEKALQIIVSHTEQMKHTHIYVCAKTEIVG